MAVTLVTGGIRSGKSRHAEGLASAVSEVTYVEADDEGDDGEGEEYVEEVATYYLKRQKQA